MVIYIYTHIYTRSPNNVYKIYAIEKVDGRSIESDRDQSDSLSLSQRCCGSIRGPGEERWCGVYGSLTHNELHSHSSFKSWLNSPQTKFHHVTRGSAFLPLRTARERARERKRERDIRPTTARQPRAVRAREEKREREREGERSRCAAAPYRRACVRALLPLLLLLCVTCVLCDFSLYLFLMCVCMWVNVWCMREMKKA